MVDHCGRDGKAQRPANERQWLWPQSHHHSLRSWMKTGVLLGLGFHLKRDFKGIFMTAILHRVGEGRIRRSGGGGGENVSRGKSTSDWRGLSGIIQFDWSLGLSLPFQFQHGDAPQSPIHHAHLFLRMTMPWCRRWNEQEVWCTWFSITILWCTTLSPLLTPQACLFCHRLETCTFVVMKRISY